MKWLVAQISNKQELYQLWEEDKKLLTLDFHPAMNSARIETADEKRVFLIRREGFLRNRVVLRNEYGMKLGQLNHEKAVFNEGSVELNGENFTYNIDASNGIPGIRVFRETKEVPLVHCSIDNGEYTDAGRFTKAIEFSAAESMLLMTLCWYMAVPVQRESTLEYAL